MSCKEVIRPCKDALVSRPAPVRVCTYTCVCECVCVCVCVNVCVFVCVCVIYVKQIYII